MRNRLIHTKKISNSQKRGWFQTNQAIYKVSWWHKVPKRKWLAFHQHTLDKDRKMSVFRENRIAPPRLVHYREFAFEYKMHKVGSLLSLYLENTRQEQEINKIHKWYGRQRELIQSLARERQIKAQANVKTINKFYHKSEYQFSKDKK